MQGDQGAVIRLCPRGKHNYQPVPKGIRYEYDGKDTHVMQRFWCNQCCDMQEKEVSVWNDFKPKSVAQRYKEELTT